LFLLQLSPEEDEERPNKLKSIRSELSIAREEQEENEMQPPYTSNSVVTTITEKAERNCEENQELHEVAVPKAIILQRINSKKGLKSYQLGKQLSCKWSTGAGPRIGVVRDYPSELQIRALEEVSLSPRSVGPSRLSPLSSVASPRNKEFS